MSNINGYFFLNVASLCRSQWNKSVTEICSIFPFQRIEEIMKRTRKGDQNDLKVSSHSFSPSVSTIYTKCMFTCCLFLLHREMEAMTINAHRRMKTRDSTRWTLKPWVSVLFSPFHTNGRFFFFEFGILPLRVKVCPPLFVFVCINFT